MPKPAPFTVVFNAHTDVWDATLHSGGLELIDVNLMYKINEYYDYLRYVNKKFERYTELSDYYLITNSAKSISEFYNLNTHKLKEKYQWYYTYNKDLREVFTNIQSSTDSMLIELHNYIN